MADLNQRFLTYVQTLRNNLEIAQPTQPKDSSTSVALDFATQRALVPTYTDRNTIYYMALP